MSLLAEENAALPVIESGEELLRPAHDTAQAIQERVWKAMGPEDLRGSYGPAEAASPCPGPALQGGA
jgi:hypothetical protein